MSTRVDTGLSNVERRDWPRVPAVGANPINILKPNSKAHAHVLPYLMSRIKASEFAMADFYERWRASERQAQAYIDLPDEELYLRKRNQAGAPAKITAITVPYTFATVMTIVTYLVHTFASKKPIFRVGTYKSETGKAALIMEKLLQYNADHTRLIRHLFQYFMDGELYGVAIMRALWKEDRRLRPVMRVRPRTLMDIAIPGTEQTYRGTEERVVFQGTDTLTIDPYLFFPDPRVPMSEVNVRGEYVFWRTYEGVHTLKKAEAQGLLRWTNYMSDRIPVRDSGESARGEATGGTPHPGRVNIRHSFTGSGKDFVQIDQGTIEIIPRELGLGDSDVPEKWLFAIANESQILQAEPYRDLHDKHPVAVIEPYGVGYGFGQVGIADYLGPIQTSVSWLVNSRIFNVRAVLNNMFVADPAAIEMQDLTSSEPGKIIRLKTAALGRDVRTVIHQLDVTDVTKGHFDDLKLFMQLGDSLSAVNENLRGQPHQGGRKTATEVRVAGESGASRMAAHAKRISAQGLVDLVEIMCLNYQQHLTEDFVIQVTGIAGAESPIMVSPEMVMGDFHYPVHDGALPLDNIAILDTWKEIFLALLQNPQLAMGYNMPAVFEHIAELSGVLNIEQFKIAPDQQVQQQAQAGNLVPTQDMAAQLGGIQ